MVRNKVYDSNVRQFEAMLSKHFDDANVLTICNATTGIMGVFYALGLANSEIITTPLTWQGALSGLKMLQCKIKYAKIEEPSLTLAPDSVLPLLTTNTKAIFTADFLGYPCRLDAIKEICKEHNLLLIHDAASSMGSNYNGFYSGKYADISIFSFGRHKPFTTNEGGCIVTHSNEIYEKILLHLAHPERQSIQAEAINFDAINTSLNAFAVEYGLAQFQHQMAKIKLHQNTVAFELTKVMKKHSYFQNAQPNFYKPFSFSERIDLKNHKDLPFSPMTTEFGFSPEIFDNYKIIQSLCLKL